MLEKIRTDIARLMVLYESEKKRADMLDAQLSESRQTVSECRKQITELNQEIDNLSLKSAFLSTEDNAEGKARIDRLIKEIDKCIKLLES